MDHARLAGCERGLDACNADDHAAAGDRALVGRGSVGSGWGVGIGGGGGLGMLTDDKRSRWLGMDMRPRWRRRLAVVVTYAGFLAAISSSGERWWGHPLL